MVEDSESREKDRFEESREQWSHELAFAKGMLGSGSLDAASGNVECIVFERLESMQRAWLGNWSALPNPLELQPVGVGALTAQQELRPPRPLNGLLLFPAATRPMIHIEQLEFCYRDSAFRLRIPELQTEAGESVVVAGPSGSGKTTLLNLIAGILQVQSGSIRIGETRVTDLGEAERRLFRLQRIGLVFQDFQLIDYLDVLGNVLLPCRIHPSVRLTSEIQSRGRELLEAVGLGRHISRSIVKLSQGERQRVALCRALLLSPQVVLADEPTGNLDPGNSGRMVDLLLKETSRVGATLMMVTHDHSLLPRFHRTIPFESFLERDGGGS